MYFSSSRKQETISKVVFLVTVSVLTFLCGVGFDRLIIQQQQQQQTNSATTSHKTRRGLRTTGTHSSSNSNGNNIIDNKEDYKRNFEACDQTWNDMDYNYPQFHEDAARNINTTEIDNTHR